MPKQIFFIKFCWQNKFFTKRNFTKKNLPKKFHWKLNCSKKICQKDLSKQIYSQKTFRQKKFPKKRFSQSFFASKILFSLKELSWVKIQLKYNLGSWSLAFRLNLKKYDKTGSFRWFSLVDFWFSWVGLVFLTLTAVLGGNSTYTKPRRLKFCMPVQIKKMGDQIFGPNYVF